MLLIEIALKFIFIIFIVAVLLGQVFVPLAIGLPIFPSLRRRKLDVPKVETLKLDLDLEKERAQAVELQEQLEKTRAKTDARRKKSVKDDVIKIPDPEDVEKPTKTKSKRKTTK